jgi:class 3 adenylate cyclase
MANRIKKDKRHCVSVITDIRNFSKTFKDFQYNESDAFLEFIDEYYLLENNLARTLSDKVYVSSQGDSILSIFLDKKDSHKKAYAYILLTHRMLGELCDKFMKDNPGASVSFGLGADSGNVWKAGDGYLRTYVGTAINRSSRIESITKGFADSTTAIGNSLYKSLLKEFYPSSYKILNENPNYDAVLVENAEAILISKEFALQYIYNMPLKGIDGSAPIFRMSEELIKNDVLFWNLLNQLVGEEKLAKIKKLQ